MAYQALVTRITNVHKDPNSERLWLGECFCEGVIVGPDMQEGDLVLYLPSDGKVERWFGNEFQLFRYNEDGTKQGGYIEDNQHIRAIKLRGNRSSGVVIPYSHIVEKFGDLGWQDGDKVTDINGEVFCSKYIPKATKTPVESAGRKRSYKGRKIAEIIYPEFAMHTDTAQLKYNLNAFHVGDQINLTLKMHGTSQRTMLTYAVLPNGFFRKLLRLKPKTVPAFVLGTRRCVLTKDSTGYYGNDAFRWPHHEKLRDAIEDGMEVFMEIVGYYGPDESQTIMPSADNAKMNDKDFIREFGERTVFSYGCQPGESEAYIYRITANNGDYEYTPDEITAWCNKYGFKRVPVIDNFVFTTPEDLLARIDAYFEDIHDPIGKTHIKEGVVVRIVNRRTFTAFKIKTWEFQVLSSIMTEAIGENSFLSDDIISEI